MNDSAKRNNRATHRVFDIRATFFVACLSLRYHLLVVPTNTVFFNPKPDGHTRHLTVCCALENAALFLCPFPHLEGVLRLLRLAVRVVARPPLRYAVLEGVSGSDDLLGAPRDIHLYVAILRASWPQSA